MNPKMKEVLKKKMQHHINLHITVGDGKSKTKEEMEKESDLAPNVEDVHGAAEGSPAEEAGESPAVEMAEGEDPSSMQDQERMKMLTNIGADAQHKNPHSLRGKAMYAAGQELERLKAKPKMKIKPKA